MVGRGGLEPPTSRLSGVRSNHLSYRPSVHPKMRVAQARRLCRKSAEKGQRQATENKDTSLLEDLKRYEDGLAQRVIRRCPDMLI